MKRTRVFMIAGSMLLAIVGVAASKANKFADSYYYWNPSAPVTKCITLPSAPCGAEGTTLDCIYKVGTTNYATYYTQANHIACELPLKYDL